MSNSHGANLYELSKKYGFDYEKILDFSSNINPFGASKKALDYIKNHIDIVSIYPDPEYRELKSSISNYCKCEAEHILLGNGATSLISGYIKAINPKKSLLIQPAYSEYESELLEINSEILTFQLTKENSFKIDILKLTEFINLNSIELGIICNPNNPTGTILDKDEISYLLENTSCKFLIDETYIEFSNEDKYSSAPLTKIYKNLLTIRGTSKFFSTPGIRLGYGITSDVDILHTLSQTLDLWGINIIASTMGELMFSDKAYINETYTKVSEEMNFLMTNLNNISGLKPYPSAGNFVLCEITRDDFDSKYIYNELIKKGIAIRNCESFHGLGNKFIRVCALKPEDNSRLIEELNLIFNL